MISLNLTGVLGTSMSITVADEGEVLSTLRTWGGRGWTSGEIPAGGLNLPLCMADTFDWTLIGAREWVNPEGEQCVIYKGQTYKRRELDPNPKFKMGAAVKLSRGAKGHDLPHLKEGEEGGVQYITLLTFRGNGKALPGYEKGGQPAITQNKQLPAQEAAPVSGSDKTQKTYFAVTKGTRYADDPGRAELVTACCAAVYPEGKTTGSLSEALAWNDETLNGVILQTARTWIAEDAAQGVAQ